jgi:hypothetical protein
MSRWAGGVLACWVALAGFNGLPAQDRDDRRDERRAAPAEERRPADSR